MFLWCRVLRLARLWSSGRLHTNPGFVYVVIFVTALSKSDTCRFVFVTDPPARPVSACHHPPSFGKVAGCTHASASAGLADGSFAVPSEARHASIARALVLSPAC